MPLKCVPLNPAWADDTKLDLRAVYARRREDNWGAPILDAEGREQWDATGPLPLRRHRDWLKKRFRYITLADEESLAQAAPYLAQQGEDWRSYVQDRRARSPWNAALWAEDFRTARAAEVETLRGLIDKYGRDAVLEMKRAEQPDWTLPGELRDYGLEPAASDEPVTGADEVVPLVKRGPGRPRKAETVA